MRVSEVLHLKPEDVDDARDLLIIRNTKFRKSRLVPLHASVLTALNLYCDARACQVGNRKLKAFFVSDKRTAIADRTLHHNFEQLRRRFQWSSRGGHPNPRIHDLRHTFICRTLLPAYRETSRSTA